MKKLLLFVLLISGSVSYGQEILKQKKDYTICYSNIKIMGVNIFVDSKPYYNYNVVAKEKVKVDWSGNPYNDLEKVVKKAKKKYPNLNGLIFLLSTKHITEFIIFNE